jgi:hypothetical protein
MGPELEHRTESRQRRNWTCRERERRVWTGKEVRKCCLALGFILSTGAMRSGNFVFGQSSPSSRTPSTAVQTMTTSQPARDPYPKLIFRVYDYAHLDPTALTNTEGVAAAIFQEVGVETAWVDCPLSWTELERYPACQEKMQTTDLVLRILPKSMAMKVRTGDDALGFAKPCPEDEPACDLTVFYHRVDGLATDGYPTDRILGHVIAHEVGHVLLGPGSHSDIGIMRGVWSRHDLQHISWGLLLPFTADQRKQLRAAVLRRTKQEPATELVIPLASILGSNP